jgi:membrane-associated phospholipid phosphatase
MHPFPALVRPIQSIGFAALFLMLFAAPQASAQSLQTLESPLTWVGAAAVIGGTIMLDPWLREQLRADDHAARFTLTNVGNAVGNGAHMAMGLGGAYVVTRVLRQDRVSDAFGRAFAGLLAAGVVNGTVKWSAGRQRPVSEDGEHLDFRPFSMEDGWQSFPSGHVVTAFAAATALSIEADRGWVTAGAYSLAGIVAWSRLHEERHWASDAVAGAVSGTAASAFMVHWLKRRSTEAEVPRIIMTPGFIGLSVPVF